jgi:hypothetical protein
MADKPSFNPLDGHPRTPPSDLDGSSTLPSDVEIRLRSTERIRYVLQRCERSSAPHHLLIRIRETLISITARDRSTRSH